jgi:hypothetical protein
MRRARTSGTQIVPFGAASPAMPIGPRQRQNRGTARAAFPVVGDSA